MRVAVLVSGGVDSSVALRLLAEAGHELVAFYLKVWLEDELAHLGECPWDDDLRQVRAVCGELGVPLEVVPMQQRYRQAVIADALAELAAGRTPSPDVVCNRRVKFGAFVDEVVVGGGFDRVASGHYARLATDADGTIRLRRGVDPKKDQTYFLYRLDQDQLGRSLFPLGELHKTEVRRLAAGWGLPNRDRPDSQGICFLGSIRFDEFVAAQLGERPGEIREAGSGRLLGRHRGPWFHTVGQRRGLGLGGGPWYVTGKDLAANVVWVCHGDDLAAHRRDTLTLSAVTWIAGAPPPAAFHDRLEVKLRHSPATVPCRLRTADGLWRLELATADAGIAPGQSAVLYRGDDCLGGGVVAG